MRVLQRINASATLIIAICFFLPWEQVSCAGARETLSGFNLARHDDGLLWFIPVVMAALLLLHLIRSRREQNQMLWLASLAGGLITAYLMNRERLRAHDESALIAAQLTGWFWLSFLCAVAVIISAIALLLRKRQAS